MFKFGKDYMKSFFDQLRLVVTRLKFAFDRFVTVRFLQKVSGRRAMFCVSTQNRAMLLRLRFVSIQQRCRQTLPPTNSVNRSVRYLEDARSVS